MPRYRLTLEYDGRPFVGWQRQDNGMSVQAAIERAVLAFCGETVTASAAGRTDAGVHALAMPAQVDLAREVSARVLQDAVNFYLRPLPAAVLDAAPVGDDFHVRFSATARRYRYRIVNRRAPLALDEGRAWRVGPPLDAGAMDKAAQALVGKHDFSTFRAAQCQAASPVKTLRSIRCEQNGDEVEITVAAPSFLHHQVRSIAGSLVNVGLGRWSVDDFAAALAAADRKACGQVAPPEGLYFVAAEYGEDSAAPVEISGGEDASG